MFVDLFFLAGTRGVGWEGRLPSELGLCSRLRHVVIENAHFGDDIAAIIPTQLYGLSDVRTLRLVSSNITGTINPAIGTMTNLETLDLSGNLLFGRIPSEIGSLSRLTSLKLNLNSFDAPIPTELDLLTSLVQKEISDPP